MESTGRAADTPLIIAISGTDINSALSKPQLLILKPNLVLKLFHGCYMAALGLLMVCFPIVLSRISGRFLVHYKRIGGLARALAQSSTFDKTEMMLSETIWIASATMLWSIAAAMHLSMSLDELLFLVAVQLVMQLFPIQGFVNSGNHESGWMAAMMIFGYPAEISLQFALASHAIVLVLYFLSDW